MTDSEVEGRLSVALASIEAERAAAAASPERPAKIAMAARMLGCKPDEVVEVTHSDRGVVIDTGAGGRYIVVPDDQPDGEGKTGVMMLLDPADREPGYKIRNGIRYRRQPDTRPRPSVRHIDGRTVLVESRVPVFVEPTRTEPS